MGAEQFWHEANGKDAQEAFNNAIEKALYDYGHRGYSGTIAEKESFTEIEVPEGKIPADYVNELLDNDDPRIDDKWGPAGCVKLDTGTYLFFGWASS